MVVLTHRLSIVVAVDTNDEGAEKPNDENQHKNFLFRLHIIEQGAYSILKLTYSNSESS